MKYSSNMSYFQSNGPRLSTSFSFFLPLYFSRSFSKITYNLRIKSASWSLRSVIRREPSSSVLEYVFETWIQSWFHWACPVYPRVFFARNLFPDYCSYPNYLSSPFDIFFYSFSVDNNKDICWIYKQNLCSLIYTSAYITCELRNSIFNANLHARLFIYISELFVYICGKFVYISRVFIYFFEFSVYTKSFYIFNCLFLFAGYLYICLIAIMNESEWRIVISLNTQKL